MFIAALRGRSLLRLGLVDLGAVFCSATGFDCCASVSETVSLVDGSVCFGLLVSSMLISEFEPVCGGSLVRGVAIEVSGMLAFRAGMGKSGGRV